MTRYSRLGKRDRLVQSLAGERAMAAWHQTRWANDARDAARDQRALVNTTKDYS